MNLSDLTVGEELDLALIDRLVEEFHRVRVRPEPLPAVDQDQTLGQILEAERPIDGGVAPPDDQYPLALVDRGVSYMVGHPLTEELMVPTTLSGLARGGSQPAAITP